jgi:hypothetical protein
MHAVTVEQLEEISRKIAVRIVECSGADCSSVALDMTNFATFIDSGNDDAGQNSGDNFAYLATTGLRYVGSVPASDCPDLTALPATVRGIVDERRFGGRPKARRMLAELTGNQQALPEIFGLDRWAPRS